MKEFKYTIDGKEYKVQIDAVEGNIASVNVNGEAYKVEMEQEAEPEKKKVVLGQPAAASDDAEATPAANVNTANAVKAPLPGTDRKSTRLNSSHLEQSRMPSSA